LAEDEGNSAAVAGNVAAVAGRVAAGANGDAEGGLLVPSEGDRDWGGDLRTANPNAGRAAPPALTLPVMRDEQTATLTQWHARESCCGGSWGAHLTLKEEKEESKKQEVLERVCRAVEEILWRGSYAGQLAHCKAKH